MHVWPRPTSCRPFVFPSLCDERAEEQRGRVRLNALECHQFKPFDLSVAYMHIFAFAIARRGSRHRLRLRSRSSRLRMLRVDRDRELGRKFAPLRFDR